MWLSTRNIYRFSSFDYSFWSVILIVWIIHFEFGESFVLYAVHDVWNRPTPTPPPKSILFVGTSGNDDIGKKLSSLIKQAKHLSDQAHKKLTNQETSMDTLNKYRTLLVEELDNLELLLKRSESLFHYLRNPFIRKLLIYNKNDLELYVNYFEIIIQLYEQGNDQSIPVLTQLIMQIIDYTDADVGWLNANGFREQANKISDHSGRLQSMLKQLKQNMFQMENDNFSNQIRQILSAIVTFENLVLSVEKECNINFIYH